jgi:predicted O-methyltransferase YrrM
MALHRERAVWRGVYLNQSINGGLALKHLHHELAIAEDFWRLASAFAAIEGFLDPREGYLLNRLASEGPGIGAIVEIGSYCGRSTAFLAAGSKSARREKVVAIDHFKGSAEHQAGQEFASATLAREGTTFNRFRDNLLRVGLFDYVQPIQASSLEAASRWSAPIRLVFIDGDHTYEAARADFDTWAPFVVAGGLVALHDVGNAPGVTRLFEEVILPGRGFQVVSGIVSLRVLQKLQLV